MTTTDEDQDTARRLAATDLARARKQLRDMGIPYSRTCPDEIGTAALDAQTLLRIAMTRGDLTKRTAREMAEGFRKARIRSPQSPVMIEFAGYDDDPRELWQFPEVCRYLKWWSRFAGIGDWQAAAAVPWLDPSWGIGLLVACGVFGDDHPFDLKLPPAVSIM
jgi:hypothetical protein